MKNILFILLVALLTIGMIACGAPAVQETPDTSKPSATAIAIPTPEAQATPSPTPEPKAYAPQDIFGSDFNPFFDTDFPEYFNVFAASFGIGSAKLEGKAPYSLFMTASDNTDEAISFIASLAGLSEDEKVSRTDEYNGGGFSEFQSKDGVTFIIRKTNPDDDRYEYVDGCLIEIQYNVDAANIEKYTNLVRDNYNMNALSLIAEYFNTDPDWRECDFGVNLHKKEVRTSAVYPISDVEAVQRGIVDNVESDWYDRQSGSMGLSYGMIDLKIEFNGKGGAVYVTQTASEFDTALSEYVAPENSLTKLGFGFDQEGVCGVYEQHEPHYMSIAIHRPEWGEFNSGWNIECMDADVNGYSIIIWYYANEDRYDIQIDGNNANAKFEYFSATGEYGEGYPDPEMVGKVFNDAFGTQGKDFQDKPLAYFEQLVQDRFKMSMDELYVLPKK